MIGLEIHAQLQTRTKIFCGCSTAFGAAPNSQVCPVCLGLPGRPVLNRQAVDYAIKAALALGRAFSPNRSSPARTTSIRTCRRATRSRTSGRWRSAEDSRLPSTAARSGLGSRGFTWRKTRGSRCTKASPDSDRRTHIDYNRSGVPLIEIVSEPDLRSAADGAGVLPASARHPRLAA